MAQFVNIFPCELRKGPVETSLNQIFLGDVEANRVGVRVTNNGEDFALSGSCSGTAILCSGGTVALTGTISGNTAYVDLPSAVYAVEGPLEVFVAVTTSGITTTLLHAHGNAVRTDSGTVIDPGTIIPSVAALIDDIDDAIASIPADYSDLLGSLAPTFSSSTAYAAGDYVWYDGDLYQFTAAHAAGSWSGTDASAAVLTSEVSDLKGAVLDRTNLFDASVAVVGRLDTAGNVASTATDYYTSDFIPVTPGFRYYKNSPSLDAYHRYCTYNSSKTFKRAVSDSNLITIASDEAYVRFCGLNSEKSAALMIHYTAEDETARAEIGEIVPKTNKLCDLAEGYNPDGINAYTYNPNVGHEGEQYPSGTFGTGSCLFDVSDFVGQRVQVFGTQIGWYMQFTNAPGSSSAPGYFNGGKTNGSSAETIFTTILSGTKYLAVNITGYVTKVKLYADNRLVDKSYIDERFGAEKWYAAIGDSITAGTGASAFGKSFYWLLSERLMADNAITKRINIGVGGAGAAGVAANSGTCGLYITSDITIPATATGVTIALNIPIKNAGNTIIEANRLNDCYLSGIAGKLTYSNSNYVFTRNESGDEKFVAAGSPLMLYGGKIAETAEILTIFAGTNNALDTNPSAEKNNAVIELIDTMTRLSKNGKYLVISPYVNSVNSDFRTALSQKYGQRFVDLYAYMSGQSVYDALAEELIDSGSQSDWATIMLYDGTHPNDVGHRLIYERIYQQMTELGWV